MVGYMNKFHLLQRSIVQASNLRRILSALLSGCDLSVICAMCVSKRIRLMGEFVLAWHDMAPATNNHNDRVVYRRYPCMEWLECEVQRRVAWWRVNPHMRDKGRWC